MKTNVYKLILGLVFILTGFSIRAQQEYTYIPLVKSGTQVWYDNLKHYESSYQAIYKTVITDEDTVISGYNCKKIYRYRDTCNTSEIMGLLSVGGIREDNNKRVYIYGMGTPNYTNIYDGVSPLFYDFSLLVGDSLQLYEGSGYVYVATIDTIDISGSNRKRFSFSQFRVDTSSICMQWIEGIGCLDGLIFPPINHFILGGEDNGFLRCYEYNDELIYHNENISFCDELVSLDAVSKEDNGISIYPNPANSKVNINSTDVIHLIEIYNALGQKVYQTKVAGKSTNIKLNSFVKGIYVLQITTDKGLTKQKIVKE